MKYVIFTAGTWTKKLLTLDRFAQIEYFVDNDPNKWNKKFCIERKKNELNDFWGKQFIIENEYDKCNILTNKMIYSPEVLKKEIKKNIIIIIGDKMHYEEISYQLIDMGFIENIHFFNGWELTESFYKKCINSHLSWIKYEKYNDINYVNEKWELRTKIMSKLIPSYTNRIVDLGCGDGKLKKYLSKEIKYIPVDYCDRGINNIIMDFNSCKVPQNIADADTIFMAGVFIYIDKTEKFLKQFINSKCIILDFIDGKIYERLDGKVMINRYTKNYITLKDLIKIMKSGGFYLTDISDSVDDALIYKFEKIR